MGKLAEVLFEPSLTVTDTVRVPWVPEISPSTLPTTPFLVLRPEGRLEADHR